MSAGEKAALAGLAVVWVSGVGVVSFVILRALRCVEDAALAARGDA